MTADTINDASVTTSYTGDIDPTTADKLGLAHGWWAIAHMAHVHGDRYGFQVMYPYTAVDVPRYRNCYAGTWSEWQRFDSLRDHSLITSAVTNSSGIANVDISGLSDFVISSARGVIATLNGRWGTAGVLNATLDKLNKSVIIMTNTQAGYNLEFAIVLI